MNKIFSKRNFILFLILTLVSFIFILMLESNVFRHGFYSNSVRLDSIYENSLEYLNLTDEGYVIKFSPQNKLFAGFDVILANLENDASGSIVLEIIDSNNNIVDKMTEKLSSMKNLIYYKFYANVKLEANVQYTLHMYTKDCDTNPRLILVDKPYISSEQTNGDVLLGYAYAHYTFTDSERILLILIIISMWLFISANLLNNEGLKKECKFISLFIILVALMSWNYTFNTFDSWNNEFYEFQKSSENLVIDVIEANENNISIDGYGLGVYDRILKKLVEYPSQYGLQGKVFASLEKVANYKIPTEIFNDLCSIATSITLVLIVLLIAKKYNKLMAFCFYSIFLLSPWIVNFAGNLYWVEFTWFLPVLLGLFCSININNRKLRIVSYIGVFLSIMIKCLCGYEYTSVIMLGTICFLLSDAFKSLIDKDKKKFNLIFRTTFIIGVVALLGFFVAICIHSNLRGDGNLVDGIKLIIEEDVLRRTNGGDLNNFPEVYWPSLNASIWEVVCMYFHFSANIIPGVPGNLFPLLSLIPLVILIYNYCNRKINWIDASLYGLFFITTVSWFVLGKSHSYIHTHMNYVLWYFGYVQICFYIIIKQIKEWVELNKNINVVSGTTKINKKN